jgi:hypothetical protein
MKCTFDDGFEVDYSDSLRIRNGSDINVFLKGSSLTEDIRNDLDRASLSNSCGEMRRLAEAVTERFGKKACIHE